jgi:hypothetical protein
MASKYKKKTTQANQANKGWRAKKCEEAQSQQAITKRMSVRDAQSFFHGSGEKWGPHRSQFAGAPPVNNVRHKLDYYEI